jgi:MoaA/NifB/PqqE/SkfB family radical SAM enzyme|tara:strand:+ start:199 stop:1245 length:1047 start_codon:yes stop_codon:yes gene_type:complete
LKNIPFCLKPFNELSYSTDGTRPCCVWEGEKFNGQIEEYNSSKYLKRIKKSMYSYDMNILKNTCRNCIENEKNRLYSPRLTPNNFKIFEYWPSNICNLKCIMCNSSSSNLIEEEEISLGILKPHNKTLTDITKFDFTDYNIIKIFGGEPTASIHTFTQLKSIIDRGYAKNMKIAYTTNATSYNKIWYNIANQFVERDVGISVDGTGKVFEYIRQNAKWSAVEKNIFKIIEDAEDYKISIVLQATSFLLADKWIDFFFQFPIKNIGLYQLYDVPGRLTAIPNDIKNTIVNRLERKNNSLSNKVIDILNNTTHDAEELKKYKEYILMLDARRGTNIYDVDPIFQDILTRV